MCAANAHNAIPFDVPGVELTHDGPLCSFDAFLKKYRLRDPALSKLAANFTDDQALLAAGLIVYDALYTWCQSLSDEHHGWYPEKLTAEASR
jgi:hypothetical protein